MPNSRREMRGSRAFAVPLFGVALLLASYWLLSDWQALPLAMSSLMALVHLPNILAY